MDADKLKQLNKVIAICRKNGIRSIEIDDIKLSFNDNFVPKTTKNTKKQPNFPTDNQEITSDGASPEDLLFWSVNQTGIDERNKQ